MANWCPALTAGASALARLNNFRNARFSLFHGSSTLPSFTVCLTTKREIDDTCIPEEKNDCCGIRKLLFHRPKWLFQMDPMIRKTSFSPFLPRISSKEMDMRSFIQRFLVNKERVINHCVLFPLPFFVWFNLEISSADGHAALAHSKH